VTGNTDVTGTGSVTLSVGTGAPSPTTGVVGGSTTVTLVNAEATMSALVPAGAFSSRVAFTVDRIDPAVFISATGLDASGAAAVISPLTAYHFSFAIPTLNQAATLTFEVDVAGLGAVPQAAFLTALASGSTSLAVKGDAAGSVYQAFPVCALGQTAADLCVEVVALDANGVAIPLGDLAVPAFVRFVGAAGSFSTYAVVIVAAPPDGIAPTTIASIAAAPNAAGWNHAAVNVGLTATDNPGGSGVRQITFTATGAGPVATTTVAGAATSLAVAAQGVTTVTFSATDNEGNVEAAGTLTVRVDTGAPATTANVGIAGGSATVTLTAADAVSGVAATTYTINGGAQTPYTGPFPVSGIGTFVVAFQSTDNTGNVEPARTTSFTLGTTVGPQAVCTTLGGTPLLDVDLFSFSATAGEKVTVRLGSDPAGSFVNGNAVLTLFGPGILKVDATAVPHTVAATVPRAATYYVSVSEPILRRGRFSGAFCVTLESTGNAPRTFVMR
jgi:hypothetical protein